MNDEIIELNSSTDASFKIFAYTLLAGFFGCAGVIFLIWYQLPHPSVEMATMASFGICVALALLQCVLRESYLMDFGAGQLILRRRLGPWESRRSTLALDDAEQVIVTSHTVQGEYGGRELWGLKLLTKTDQTILLLSCKERAHKECTLLAAEINRKLGRSAPSERLSLLEG